MFAVLLAADAGVTDEWLSRAVEGARAVATCRVDADCDAKLARSREWIRANSRFAVARETDSLTVTYGAIYASTDPSLLVSFDPPQDGTRTIRFRAWCGNVFMCRPSPRSLRALFRQAMEDVRP